MKFSVNIRLQEPSYVSCKAWEGRKEEIQRSYKTKVNEEW